MRTTENQTKMRLQRITLTIAALLMAGTVRADITTGLVRYYKFDDGSGETAADSSGSADTATLVNTPAWVTGRIGGGLQFASAGSESASFTAVTRTDAEAWSWAAWVDFTDTGTNNTLSGVGDSTSNIILKAGNTSITVRTAAAANRTFTVAALTTVFRHIVVTRAAGGNINVYVDGVASVSGPISDAGAMTFSKLGIRNSDLYLNGTLDEVRIYTVELSVADVAELYHYGQIPKRIHQYKLRR